MKRKRFQEKSTRQSYISRLTFYLSRFLLDHPPTRRTSCNSTSLQGAVFDLLLSEPMADSSSAADGVRADHERIGDRPPNRQIRPSDIQQWVAAFHEPPSPPRYRFLSRMLKKSACFVLGSSKSSTYPSRKKSCSDSSGLGGWKCYASGFDSPVALLDELFEHPAGKVLLLPQTPGPLNFCCVEMAFSQPVRAMLHSRE